MPTIKPDLILGSSSPRRIELLSSLGVPFRVIKPEVLEQRQKNEGPAPYTLRNARLKADRVLVLAEPRNPSHPCLIISADTIVLRDEQVLEKPVDVSDAISMLSSLSGRQHTVLTGLCLLYAKDAANIQIYNEVVLTEVTLKPLTLEEVVAYVATGEPMDKSGSYAIQGMGGYMVKKIQGSYTNVVGMPLAELISALSREFNIDLWRWRVDA